jgi:hypothetical protein
MACAACGHASRLHAFGSCKRAGCLMLPAWLHAVYAATSRSANLAAMPLRGWASRLTPLPRPHFLNGYRLYYWPPLHEDRLTVHRSRPPDCLQTCRPDRHLSTVKRALRAESAQPCLLLRLSSGVTQGGTERVDPLSQMGAQRRRYRAMAWCKHAVFELSPDGSAVLLGRRQSLRRGTPWLAAGHPWLAVSNQSITWVGRR